MAVKPTKRKAFNFLRSYFDVLNEIPEKDDKLNYLLAIINKQFLDEDPKDLNFITNLCYESQRHAIEKSVKGWKTAEKTDTKGDPILPPTLPPKGNPILPLKEEEEQVKEKGKEEVKGKEQNKIEERKLKFADTLKPFIEIYGRELIKEFYGYWTEPNKSNTKFKQELERTWSLERRLETWSKNDKNFNNGKFKNNEQRNKQLGELTAELRRNDPTL